MWSLYRWYHSSLGWCSSKTLNYVQKAGGGVYFNPFVEVRIPCLSSSSSSASASSLDIRNKNYNNQSITDVKSNNDNNSNENNDNVKNSNDNDEWMKQNAGDSAIITPTKTRMMTTTIKYGVASYDILRSDLRGWEYGMYLAGRMQKPIVPVKLVDINTNTASHQQEQSQKDNNNNDHEQNNDAVVSSKSFIISDEIQELQANYNLRYALSAGLLMLDFDRVVVDGGDVHTVDLYESIAGLSYIGDPRLTLGAEDPGKAGNIVRGDIGRGKEGEKKEDPRKGNIGNGDQRQLERFHNLYRNGMERLETKGLLSLHHTNRNKNVKATDKHNIASSFHINLSDPSVRISLVHDLPPILRNVLLPFIPLNISQVSSSSSSSCSSIGILDRDDVSKCIANVVVGKASRGQMIKGLFTAGPVRSTKYAIAKLVKGMLGRRRLRSGL